MKNTIQLESNSNGNSTKQHSLNHKIRENYFFLLASCLIWFLWLRKIGGQGWYDEFSVLANISSSSKLHFGESLNWLQSMPFGYFYLGKFFSQFGLSGVYVLRLLSAVCVFASAVILIGMAKSLGKYSRGMLLLVLSLNPVMFTYALAAKPYALEILFGIIGFRLIVNRQIIPFFIAVFLSIPFGSTLAIFNGSLLLYTIVLYTSKKFLLLGSLYFICVLFLSKFTSNETREIMSQAWFGPPGNSIVQNFKSSIGNLLWFPISGLGISPELGSSKGVYLACGLVMLIILSTIYFSKTQTPGKYISFTCLIAAAFLQTIQLLPAAGRLLLPLSFVIWLELFLATLSTKSRLLKRTILFVTLYIVVIQIVSPSPKYSLSEEVSSLRGVISAGTNIYSVQDFAPLVEYTSNLYGGNLSPNLLIQNPKTNGVEACSEISLSIGDVLLLNSPVKESYLRNLDLISSHNFSLYRVQIPLKFTVAPETKLPLNCSFRFGNPEFPIN